jgi:hypothetical protein
MKAVFVSLWLAASLSAGLFIEENQVPTAAVRSATGVVVWADTGQPVVDAVVTLKNSKGDSGRQATDSLGQYRFDVVPAESFLEVAVLRSMSYGVAVDWSQEFKIDVSGSQKLLLPRPKRALSLKGQLDLANEREGVEVQVRSVGSSLRVGQSTFTDRNGSFQFYDLIKGKYDLQVLALARLISIPGVEVPRSEVLVVTNRSGRNLPPANGDVRTARFFPCPWSVLGRYPT